MSTRIGFVILSHNNPQQLRRLVGCLQRVYDNPPIVIHHDFSQSTLRRDDFPSNTHFVIPHLKTGWGKFSVVVAVLRALAELYSKAAPDWFVLLSGADYPTMRASEVVKELNSSGADALLDYRQVPKLSDATHGNIYSMRLSRYAVEIGDLQFSQSPSTAANTALQHFDLPNNMALAWRRYVGFRLWFPVIRRGPRIGRYSLHLPLEDPQAPFTAQFKCFYGDHWFAGNQKTAGILLSPTKQHLRLRRYLHRRQSAEECYYQTVLGNSHDLRISKATKRFSDWSQSAGGPGGAHPKVLGLSDLEAIVSSKSYFARKFVQDSPVLREIDKMLS